MILDTPPAERTIPTTMAAVPRKIRALVTLVRPALVAIIENEMMDRIGGSADATNFLKDGVDEMEAVVRKRMGKEKTSTAKNPSTHNVAFDATVPATAPSGNATMSKNHDRISNPISRLKFRTLSP